MFIYTNILLIEKGGDDDMAKLLLELPDKLKAKLDALRRQGYTASGYIRALLERELRTVKPITKKGG